MDETVKVGIDVEPIDEAIEKANQLCKLLREAQQLIDSLLGKTSKSQLDIKLTLKPRFRDAVNNFED